FFFQVAQRYNKPFSLALIDVDSFKSINDTHGHAAGDFVLKTIARLLNEVLRKSDIIVRYGGDEFVIIFPEVGETAATAGINRVVKRISMDTFIFEDLGIEISFSISFGAVEFQNSFESETQMFDLADAKLYENKKIN
ncbi:MAG: GGDEF domain-containing protein, partial [Candidatus Theseobacter exili]|nr:GGDEF domain-containing protein [Candidatus Theseobacter exili]